MVNQSSTRRFGNSDAFELVWFSKGANVLVENIGLVKDLLDPFDSVEDLYQARVMLMKGAQNHAPAQRSEFGPFLVSLRRSTTVNNIQSCQRPDPVDAIGITVRFEVRRFKVGERIYRLGDIVLVLQRIDLIQNDVTGRVHEAQHSFVMFELCLVYAVRMRSNQTHEQARKIT